MAPFRALSWRAFFLREAASPSLSLTQSYLTTSLSPLPGVQRRKGAEGVYWALVPPSICLLVWGGEGASDADPALGKPGVIQEILQTHCLSSAPLA